MVQICLKGKMGEGHKWNLLEVMGVGKETRDSDTDCLRISSFCWPCLTSNVKRPCLSPSSLSSLFFPLYPSTALNFTISSPSPFYNAVCLLIVHCFKYCVQLLTYDL
ncbi:hypothetical protein Droror1_Dr00001453 [Drosera rotundifolia]